MQMSQENLKEILLKKQQELNNRLTNLKEQSSREDNPVSADFEEQAVEREGEDVIEEVGRVTRIELGEIKIALERLEAGTYGTCGECGDPIPLKRLEVMPMAMYCMDCQQYMDERNR